MFKVLVVAYYFPPMGLSGVQRTLKFVKYMKKYNWDPTVITTGNVAYFAHDDFLKKELADTQVKIIRISGSRDPNSLLSKFGTVNLPSELLRNLFDKHPFIDQIPSTSFNFLSSNNCNLKLSCTFGLATIIIRLFIPICFK